MSVFSNTVPTHIDTSSEILGYALGLFGSGSGSGSVRVRVHYFLCFDWKSDSGVGRLEWWLVGCDQRCNKHWWWRLVGVRWGSLPVLSP